MSAGTVIVIVFSFIFIGALFFFLEWSTGRYMDKKIESECMVLCQDLAQIKMGDFSC